MSNTEGFNLDELDRNGRPEDQDFSNAVAKDLEAIYDIPVQISAVLGKATMQVSQLLKLGRGAVVELDRKVLATLAVESPEAFNRVVEAVK